MSNDNIVFLIEEKIQKEKDKIVQSWADAGIRVEKARWGRHHIIRGKQKIEIGKEINASELTLSQAEKYLGKYFDFHGGGIDLIFPHHENEIAQSVCANDYQKLSNYWLHNGYGTVDKQKMSKSLGNFITINELKNNYNGQVIRLAMLSTHYTQPFDWNKNILENSRKSLEKWYEFYSDKPESINDANLKYLLDDLNTPLMISNINDLYKKAKSGDTLSAEQLSSSCKILGLFNQNAEEWKNSKKIGKMPPEEIEQLILQRNEARAKKDFETSDKIRDLLVSKGVLIKDKDGNTSWEYK